VVKAIINHPQNHNPTIKHGVVYDVLPTLLHLSQTTGSKVQEDVLKHLGRFWCFSSLSKSNQRLFRTLLELAVPSAPVEKDWIPIDPWLQRSPLSSFFHFFSLTQRNHQPSDSALLNYCCAPTPRIWTKLLCTSTRSKQRPVVRVIFYFSARGYIPGIICGSQPILHRINQCGHQLYIYNYINM
jgi:hypothetical protein